MSSSAAEDVVLVDAPASTTSAETAPRPLTRVQLAELVTGLAPGHDIDVTWRLRPLGGGPATPWIVWRGRVAEAFQDETHSKFVRVVYPSGQPMMSTSEDDSDDDEDRESFIPPRMDGNTIVEILRIVPNRATEAEPFDPARAFALHFPRVHRGPARTKRTRSTDDDGVIDRRVPPRPGQVDQPAPQQQQGADDGQRVLTALTAQAQAVTTALQVVADATVGKPPGPKQRYQGVDGFAFTTPRNIGPLWKPFYAWAPGNDQDSITGIVVAFSRVAGDTARSSMLWTNVEVLTYAIATYKMLQAATPTYAVQEGSLPGPSLPQARALAIAIADVLSMMSCTSIKDAATLRQECITAVQNGHLDVESIALKYINKPTATTTQAATTAQPTSNSQARAGGRGGK